MRPIKWGISISSHNKIPPHIKSDNEAKCLHALRLLNKVATEKQKEILASKDASDSAAREASHEAVQTCMTVLLNMEFEVGFKTKEQIQKKSSRSKPTAIAIGMRYQKITTHIEELEKMEKKKERKKASMARHNG